MVLYFILRTPFYSFTDAGESRNNKISVPSLRQKKLPASEMASIFFPPSSEKLVEARKLATKRRYMWQVMKEVVFQVVFVWCFTVVCYGSRTSDRFRVTKVFYDTFRYTHKVWCLHVNTNFCQMLA